MVIWSSVLGYEGIYEVSNKGEVRSIQRTDCRGQRTPERILKQGNKTSKISGKTVMRLVTLCKDRVRETKYIHHLVAHAFIGPRPHGLFVCHIDGDATNNSVENLYYGTPAENMADASRHGTTLRGKKNKKAKLTEDQVLAMRDADLSARGAKALLARTIGVSASTVSSAINHANWRWLSA